MKIGFIGAGRVGSVSAYTVIHHLKVDEIVLVDIDERLAEGEALDLLHASYALKKPIKVVGGSDYSLLDGSDLIVISAGVARKPGMTRLDLLHRNAEIMREISKKLKNCVGNSLILVVTNPVDLMTYLIWKETDISRKRIFGMGGLLDTARLWSLMGRVGESFVMGEHGETMFIVKGDKKFQERVRKAGMEVISRKGATIYGPATCVYRMIRAVIEDLKEILPASVVLQGEYGLRELAIGVPIVLGRDGVEKIIELEGVGEELRRSAEILRQKLREIGY
ncbi:MAG TPA: malate dehydrogenase [Nitrososphaeria archaeon]|nr:malate dehydrogenase [Nitrososphaeria archaeon]